MAVIRMRRDEMNLVLSAAERKGKRTNSRLVINEERVEVAEEEEVVLRQPDTDPLLRT